jgi:hypothetical protein
MPKNLFLPVAVTGTAEIPAYTNTWQASEAGGVFCASHILDSICQGSYEM